MREDKLKLLQQDIDEALVTIETMEKDLEVQATSKDTLKEKFEFLSDKMKELESILKDEGIL